MADLKQVTVPDIGDFSDVAVVEVHVAQGDEVAENDPLVTLETDKATMDVPAPFGGVVAEVLLKVGDVASEGTPVVVAERERRGGRDRGGRRAQRRADRRGGRGLGAPGAGREGAAGAQGAGVAVRQRWRAGLRQPVGAPAGARAGRGAGRRRGQRAQGADRRRGRARGGRRRRRARRRAVVRRRRRPRSAAVAQGRLRQVRRDRARRAVEDPQDLGGQPVAQLGPDPARHPQRRGRRHRPGGVPQAAQQRAVRRQGHDGRAAAEGGRGVAEGLPATSTRRWTATRWSARSTTTWASRPTRPTGSSCRSSRTSTRRGCSRSPAS